MLFYFLFLYILEAVQVNGNYEGHKSEAHVYRENNGAPIPSYTASRTCGKNGPIVMEDMTLIEQLANFDRERIPERVVHANGGGAHGYFEVTHDITKYSKAVLFSKIGLKTPIFVRFSLPASETGSADTVRDIRGFAIKFYTKDGIWDLVGNNTPIFFIRDPMLFIAVIRSRKRNPVTHQKDLNTEWDFVTLRHEALFQQMITYTDGGTPDGFRHMHGFGSNTFVLVNDQDEAFYCKFHYLSNQGIRNLTAEESVRLAGENPDYSKQDLYEAIEKGNYPSWTLYIQVMTFERAKELSFNVLDVTKIWPENEFPLIQVGRFVLNRNPDNYFAQVEQVAFCPQNLIPGIQNSRDKVMQARVFAYKDSQRHRLGPNFMQIPVNRPPKAGCIINLQRDGDFAIFNQKGEPNYYPNSDSPYHPDISQDILNYTVHGTVKRYDDGDEDNYSQPRKYYAELSEKDKAALAKNIGAAIRKIKKVIQDRAIRSYALISEHLAKRIAHEAGLEYHSWH